jgi:hypothetical protein
MAVTTAAPRTGAVSVAPLFISRTAGLPLSTVAPLRSSRTAGWASAVLRLEQELRERAEPVKDVLEAAIGGNPDRRARRDLIQARRDVHNLRAPRSPETVLSHLQGTGPGQAATTPGEVKIVAEWLRLAGTLEGLQDHGEAAVADDQREALEHLRHLAGLDVLRRGIQVASPDLDDAVNRFLAGRLTGKRARRVERSLAQYVYRTAAKTSPFSTFTTVSLGRVADDVVTSLPADPASLASLAAGATSSAPLAAGAASPAPLAASPAPARSRARINVAVLPRIAEQIAATPELREEVPLALVSGVELDPARLRYVRRHRIRGEQDATVSLDTMSEHLFYLTASDFLAAVVDHLGHVGTATPRELRPAVVARLHHEVEAADVDHLIDILLRLDLLVFPDLQVNIHAVDPVVDFCAALRALGLPWARTVAAHLEAATVLTDEFTAAGLQGRAQVLADLRGALGRALRAVGAQESALPRQLLYEDTAAEQDVTADPAVWEGAFGPDLDRVARILPVFDVLQPQRYLLRGFFTVRFGNGGECADLPRLVHDFHQDIFDEYLKARPEQDAELGVPRLPNWLQLPEIDALNEARAHLVRGMRAAYAALPADATEMVLGDELFEEVADLLPPPVEEVDPRSFFVQVAARDDDDPLLVLNRTYTGLTLMFSRFAHCLDGAGGSDALGGPAEPGAPGEAGLAGQLSDHLATVQPEGAVFAEMTGGIDTTNLNLHPAVTPYELVCPGDRSFRPADEQIDVTELLVRHDPVLDSLYLYCPRLGKRVIPVYLGYLLPLALPDIHRVLLLFSLGAMAQLDMWTGTDEPLGDRMVGSHPRLRHGNVVLVRTTWKTDPARLPRRDDHADEAQWFLAWQRWRLDAGLPDHVFATLSAADGEPAGEADDAAKDSDGGQALTTNKPQYIDFSSRHCLMILDEMVATGAARLVFNEMLPGPDELWFDGPDGAHVTEQTVEMIFSRRTR